MRREMQQLAALLEAAAAGEAWAAEPAPHFAEGRIATARILGPSRDPFPPLLLVVAGGAGLALGGWPWMLAGVALAALLPGTLLRRATWPWLQARAARELAAALPRFLHARLDVFDGTGVRQGGHVLPSGIALVRGSAGAPPLLILVQQGLAARVPWGLVRGWAWTLGEQAAAGGAAPPATPNAGLWVLIADQERPIWHVALTDPATLRAWGERLDAPAGSLWALPPKP